MHLDTDLDLMKIVGGPVFVWGPTVGSTGGPDGLDPSEVPDDVPTSFHMIQAYERGGRCSLW